MLTSNRSLINPPTDFIPEGITPDEARWLRKMLELDFDGRDIVLAQISSAHIKRVVDADSVEVFFEEMDASSEIESSCSAIVAMDANQGKSPYVPSELNVLRKRIDSMYIYMPDMSDLVLSEISLDDVEYEIAPYEMRARREIYELFDESGAARLHEFGSFLLARAEGNKKRAQSMLMDTARSLRGEVGAGLGPFSLSLRVDLGSDGTDSYAAIAQCSLVGNYFLSYIEKNGRESQYPPGGGFSATFWAYPHGERVGRLRRSFYENGFMPLTYSQTHHRNVRLDASGPSFSLKHAIWNILFTLGRTKDVYGPGLKLADCYFTGDKLLQQKDLSNSDWKAS